MMRNKKLRTVFCGILIFLLVFALFCLGDYGIRYYHTPIKKDYDYTGTGMLVSLTEPDTFEQVSVEIHGKALHYLWGNQEDAIAGNVFSGIYTPGAWYTISGFSTVMRDLPPRTASMSTILGSLSI